MLLLFRYVVPYVALHLNSLYLTEVQLFIVDCISFYFKMKCVYVYSSSCGSNT